jgi:preprotein translocase subunit YajC
MVSMGGNTPSTTQGMMALNQGGKIMNDLVFAMGGGQGQGGAEGAGFGAFIPLILMFAIFYFLLIRPQQKRTKQHREMIASLKKGDRVVTTGGLHGQITGLTDDVITMEIAPKVRVKVSRQSIAGKLRSGDQ